MSNKLDAALKERGVRLVREHRVEYPWLPWRRRGGPPGAAGSGDGAARPRHAEIDAGERESPTSEELVEIKELKVTVRRKVVPAVAAKRVSASAKTARTRSGVVARRPAK